MRRVCVTPQAVKAPASLVEPGPPRLAAHLAGPKRSTLQQHRHAVERRRRLAVVELVAVAVDQGEDLAPVAVFLCIADGSQGEEVLHRATATQGGRRLQARQVKACLVGWRRRTAR